MVLSILQSSSITGASPSDYLVSYPGHLFRGGGLSLQRCSWRILQSLPTGPLEIILFSKLEYFKCIAVIGQVGRVFADGPGDVGSIPSCVIPKTLKMVLHTSLLNTQLYKVRIKGKVEQFRERSSSLPYTSV